MMDRRSFLSALLGTAIVPKDVLAGLASPAPLKEAWKVTWVPLAAWIGERRLSPVELKKLPKMMDGPVESFFMESELNISSSMESGEGTWKMGTCVIYVPEAREPEGK